MQSASAHVLPVAGREEEERRTASQGLPVSAVLGLVAGVATLSVSLTVLQDVDLYWHILAGRELLDGVPANSIGTAWSFAPDPRDWTSTQWLSEIVLYLIHSAGGWASLAALRVITAAVTIAILAWTTLRDRPRLIAGLPFLLGVGAIAYASQERPQQATLIGASLLGGVLARGLVVGALPRWYVIVPCTVLWANLHGGWVLVPAVLGLIAIGRVLDTGIRDRTAHRALLFSLITMLSGLLTPAGVSGLTAALRFQSATTVIEEWQATKPLSSYGLLTTAMLCLFAVAWSRGGRIPWSEVLSVLSLFMFSWMAWRNVAPGLLIMAPLCAHRLVQSFAGPNSIRPEPRWSIRLGVSLFAIFLGISLLGLVGRDHLPRSEYPLSLIEQVGDLPPGQRVLNDYGVSGLLLLLGGPDTQVGIDGRTDRYGAQYIQEYVSLLSLEGNWQGLLSELRPTSALLQADSALTHVLITERRWTVVGKEPGWVLLSPPGGDVPQAPTAVTS